MPTLSRSQIFAQAARKMRADFEELTIVPHNASKGHEAEEIVRRFLNGHLPQRFRAGAGFVIDPSGSVSNQTDVVIYDAHNCPVYRASDTAAIYPSNNVAAVVEVKSRLTKAAFEDAAMKVAAIKAMTKAKPKETGTYTSSQTMGLLFAFASDIDLSTAASHYKDSFFTHGLGRHIDVVAVLDSGILTLVGKMRGIPGWNVALIEGAGGPGAEGSNLAVSTARFGQATLDVFLRLLLPQLAHFRHIVGHPGFDFSALSASNEMELRYLTSITLEKKAERRAAKLREYAAEVKREFDERAAKRGGE